MLGKLQINKFTKWRLLYQKQEQIQFDRVVITHLQDAYEEGLRVGREEMLKEIVAKYKEI